jgi:dephospho-CoA kinase
MEPQQQQQPFDLWFIKFNNNIKTKTYENFNILLFDIIKYDNKQKDLLYKILFINYQSIEYWSNYIDYIISVFPDRKLQIQRLINKSMEIIQLSSTSSLSNNHNSIAVDDDGLNDNIYYNRIRDHLLKLKR